MVKAIDLVNIGGGNLGSVKRCLERLNVDFRVADSKNLPDGNHPLIVPGVGAFGPVMEALREGKLDERLKDLVKSGTPFLGICVGMQVLFDESEESKGVKGLGLVSGKVVKYKGGKVPQIGWNLIEKVSQNGHPNTDSEVDHSADKGYVYFVNSFYPEPQDQESVFYYADYYVRFCAAVKQKNITAFQFHPEKSGKFGQTLLTRWLNDVL
jgi:glutamine amidotransferase